MFCHLSQLTERRFLMNDTQTDRSELAVDSFALYSHLAVFFPERVEGKEVRVTTEQVNAALEASGWKPHEIEARRQECLTNRFLHLQDDGTYGLDEGQLAGYHSALRRI